MTPLLVHDSAGPTGAIEVPLQTVNGHHTSAGADVLAVEEPLEIRLVLERDGKRVHYPVSVTMRTPGHDCELAAGFLFTEGVLRSADDVDQLRHCRNPNVVRVQLRPGVTIDLARLERHFYTTSSCGVCGKTSLEAVRVNHRACSSVESRPVDPEVIHQLPERLRSAQTVFDRTGGLHGAGLFDEEGRLICLYEDVGRHNAVDKLIGSQFLERRLPLARHILLLSGRASFELIQKAMTAELPIVAAVGAPSSLAVDLARECGMTLLGFVRNGRFNIYSGADRVT